MKSITAPAERIEFTKRLVSALANLGLKPNATPLVKIFNAQSKGNPITSHAFRKWLLAESMPTQPRICLLADWLQVTPEWLRYGNADARRPEIDLITGEVSREIYLMLRDFHMLSDHSKQLFLNTVSAMLALQRKKKGSVAP